MVHMPLDNEANINESSCRIRIWTQIKQATDFKLTLNIKKKLLFAMVKQTKQKQK